MDSPRERSHQPAAGQRAGPARGDPVAVQGRATTLLLIRHGDTAAVGRWLAGRLPGVFLNGIGRAQAARLPGRLRMHAIGALYASPLARARQTIDPLAAAFELTPRILPSLNEVDFGEWTGLTFRQLERLPAWQRFNRERATAPVPGGEAAARVQQRVVGTLERLRTRHAGTTVALVSHADVIRAAILFYRGLSLDAFTSIDIPPASITTLQWIGDHPVVLGIDRDADAARDARPTVSAP